MAMRSPRLDMSGLARTLAQDREDAQRAAQMDQAQAGQIGGRTQAMFEGMMNDDEAARKRADAKGQLAMRLASAQGLDAAKGARQSAHQDAMLKMLDSLGRYRADKQFAGQKLIAERPRAAPRQAAPRVVKPSLSAAQQILVKAAHDEHMAGQSAERAGQGIEGQYNAEGAAHGAEIAKGHYAKRDALLKRAGVDPSAVGLQPEQPDVQPAAPDQTDDESKNALLLLMQGG